MKYGSVCSGIEAATVAWHPLGWRPSFFSEIDKAPRAVLAHHYPTVPCHGDFTTIKDGDYEPIDLLVGGTPCQAFSVAGLRKGLDDARGNLTLEFIRLAERLGPRWLVWENVPGVLSVDNGRAFGSFLGGLAELGYGFAYRVLDAQYFGVPQRRRRVFVVGHLGNWRAAAAVLFERESLRGDITPSRETGQSATYSTAPSLTGSGRGTERTGESRGQDCVIATFDRQSSGEYVTDPAASTVSARDYKGAADLVVTHALKGEGFDGSEDGTGRGVPLVPMMTAPCLTSTYGKQPDNSDTNAGPMLIPAMAFQQNQLGEVRAGETFGTLNTKSNASGRNTPMVAAFKHGMGAKAQGIGYAEEQAPMLGTDAGHNAVMNGMTVRRLTPRECERLQGFPDDYTLVPDGRKMMADGPRYKMLGNSMAVPVMRWIGQRIQMIEDMKK